MLSLFESILKKDDAFDKNKTPYAITSKVHTGFSQTKPPSRVVLIDYYLSLPGIKVTYSY